MSFLEREVLNFCGRYGTVFSGKTVLCAVSGGRDSMALLHVMLRLREQECFAVAAAHYNHHLRQTAQRDEDFVRSWCDAKGIPVAVGSGDVRAFAKEHGTSIEDAARVLRYQFLEACADDLGASYIATAHHRQDNAETILLHLLRGAGMQGLCGIPPVRGRVIRPLLDTARESINQYISKYDLPYVEDESNAEGIYTRNRLRLELLPLLEELSPGSVSRIAATGIRLRADNACLEHMAAKLLPSADADGGTKIPAELLKAQDAAIVVRLLRTAAERLGVSLTAVQTDAVLRLRTGGIFVLNDSVRVLRTREELIFYRLPPAPPPLALQQGVQRWGDYDVYVMQTSQRVEENEQTVVLCGQISELTLTVWDGTGRLTVENGKRTVKRLLADHGIAVQRREMCPAVYVNEKLAAVFGAGTDRAFCPHDDELKLVIQLRRAASVVCLNDGNNK
ncbi:MAG: tRNA lysidine(34) synthetase TilS [Oscillospiraceae bacterium]|nr:tRNA lysidine(34) synthetase TilS [Oscillospiraceae bacterium]